MDADRMTPQAASRATTGDAPDAVSKVLDAMRASAALRAAAPYPQNQLHTIGEIYEEHGLGGAELYIMDAFAKNLAARDGLLAACDILHAHPAVAKKRTFGRYIFKTVNTILTHRREHV